ncbi:MAG: FIST N-terminal domain-containing protein [Propionivibrio sp.]
MQTVQAILGTAADVQATLSPLIDLNPDLVLAFGPSEALCNLAPALAECFPGARRIGCSAAFAISTAGVEQASCVVTAVRFENSSIVEATVRLEGREKSYDAGKRLGDSLPREGLRAVLLLCQGVGIRGSALLAGINAALGAAVPVVGGLASRKEGYYQTWVLDDSGCGSETIVALGLYGSALRFGFGVHGGWAPFGPVRKVTRCEGNVLYELDGEPALDVYRRYLGDYARDLPTVGHFFPFAILDRNHDEIGLIRSMLSVEEKTGGLRFGDEVKPDSYLRMMHASTDKLVGGVETAAESARRMLNGGNASCGLIFMVSCVGRELVMGERVEEEVEVAADAFGGGVAVAGFYSFGEISPVGADPACKLHNQTVMVACLDEISESAG